MSVYLRLKFVLIDDILTTFILVHFIMEVLKKKKITLKSLHPHKKVNSMKYDTWSTLVRGVMVESQMRHARSFDSMIKKYEKEAALGKSDVLDIYTCKVVIDHGSLENTPVRTFGSYAKKFSPQPKKEKKMLRDLFFLLRNSSDPEKLSCISKCNDSRLSILGDTYSELSNDSFSSKHSEVEDCFCTQGKTELGCHGHRHLKKTSSEKSDLNDSTVTSGAISTQQNRKTSANKSDLNCNTVLSNGARLTRQNFKALQQKETASENNDLKYSTLTNGTRLTRQSFKAKQQKKTSAKEDVSTSEGITQDKDEKSKSNEISSAHSLCRNKSPVVLIRRLAPLMLKNLQKDGLTVTASVSRIVQRTLRRSKRISKQNSISKYRSQKITDPQNFISFETMIANVDTSLDICNVSKNRIAVTGATASDMQHSESNKFVLHEESSASWKSAKIFTDSTEKTHNLTGVKKSHENDSCTITKQDIIPVVDTDAAESESAADTVSKQGITFVVDSDTAESVYFQHKKSIENHTVGIEPKTVLSPGESDVNYTKMNKTFTFAERKSVDNSKKISQDKQILPVSRNSRVCIKRDNESSTKSCQSECTNIADKELRYSNDTNAKENISVSANMSVNEKYANRSLCTGLDKRSPSGTTTLLEDPNNSCDYDIYDITTRLKSPLNNLDENLSVSNIKFSMCSDLQFINDPVAMSTPVCKYNSTPSSTMSRGRNKGFYQSILVKEHNIVSKCKNLEISVEEENFTPGHSKLKNEVCCPEMSREKSPSICKHCSTSDDEINFITFCDNIDSREKNSNCSVSSEDNAFLTNTCSAVPNQTGRQGDSACKYKSSISRSDLGIFCDMTSNISVKHNKKRSVVNNDKRPNLAKVESQHEHLWNTTKVNYLNTTQIKEVKSVTVCSNIKENDSNISSTELSKNTSCNYHSTEDDEINLIPLCDNAHLPETNDDHFLSPRGNTVLTGCRVTSYIEKNNTPVSPSKIDLSECNISRTELGGLLDIAKESPARHRKRTSVHNNNCSIVSQPVSMVLPKKRDPRILGVPQVYSGDFPCKNPNITAQLDNSNHVLFDEPVNCDDDECRKSTESIKRRPLCTAKYHVLEGTPNFIKSCDRMDDTETNGDHSLLSVGNNTELSSYNVTPSKIRKKDDLVCAHVLQKSISKSSLDVHHDIANSDGPVSGICSSRTISQKHDSETLSSQFVDANGSYCSNTNVTLQMDVVNSVLVDELGSSASKLPHCRNAWHSKSNTIHSDSAKVNSAHTHKYVSTLGDEINFIPILDNSDAAERNHPFMPLSGGNLDLAVMPGKGNDSVFQCKDTPVLKENNSEVSLHAICESPIKSRKKTSINDELVGHKSNLSNIKLNLTMSSSKLGLHKHKIPSEKLDVKHLTSQHMKVRKCLMYNTNTSTTQMEEINFIQIHEPMNSNFKQKLIHPIKDHGEKQSVLSFENQTKDTIHKRCSKTLIQSVSAKSYKLPSGTKVHKSEIWSKRDVNEGAASERHFCHNKLHGTETDEINFISLC